MDNIEKILSELHSAVAQDLLDRVQSGSATAAEITAALKLLKDNNITVPDPTPEDEQESVLTNLASYLGDVIREDDVPNANEYIDG